MTTDERDVLMSDVEHHCSVLVTLLRQAPSADRERLSRLAIDDLKKNAHLVMVVLRSVADPVFSINERPNTRRYLTDDIGTTPGTIRRVLAQFRDGLLTREIIEQVTAIHPRVNKGSISSALFFMCKRREIAREGFHKNYRYVLTQRKSEFLNGVSYQRREEENQKTKAPER
jgi:hypothetical protein